ncbi:MAG: hypothetical protein KIT73_10240 [Burkholderiales bacterium]|nr:hypothetical protein [Burkholderiales bacterium]
MTNMRMESSDWLTHGVDDLIEIQDSEQRARWDAWLGEGGTMDDDGSLAAWLALNENKESVVAEQTDEERKTQKLIAFLEKLYPGGGENTYGRIRQTLMLRQRPAIPQKPRKQIRRASLPRAASRFVAASKDTALPGNVLRPKKRRSPPSMKVTIQMTVRAAR